MTSGSWSFGSFSTGQIAARKQWSGSNGKYETWQGGTRSKWNGYTMVHHKQTQTGIGNVVGPLPEMGVADIQSTVGWSSNDELRLLDKLAQQVRGHSFDLGINLAEAGKSYGTILKNLRSIGSALLNLKHGNIPGALKDLGSGQRGSKRSVAKDLSGRWLETQYAFLPLIGQSYEASKALSAMSKARSLQFSVSSGARRKVVDFSSSPAGYSWPCSVTYSRRIKADLYEELSLARSMGLTNPAAIAWEVVPYSFVVDWFIPVGTYLSAWGVIPALKGRFLTTDRGGIKSGVVGAGTVGSGASYKTQQKRELWFTTKRTFSTSLSCPAPTFNSMPRALSPKRLLNAVALIHQRLR